MKNVQPYRALPDLNPLELFPASFPVTFFLCSEYIFPSETPGCFLHWGLSTDCIFSLQSPRQGCRIFLRLFLWSQNSLLPMGRFFNYFHPSYSVQLLCLTSVSARLFSRAYPIGKLFSFPWLLFIVCLYYLIWNESPITMFVTVYPTSRRAAGA